MKLTKEQYDILKKYEKHLRRGFYGNYTFALYKSDFDEMAALYKELGGTGSVKYNCNSCVLKVVKHLGKLYFEFEAEMNRNKIEKLSDEVVEAVLEEKLPDEEDDKPETTKKKTTKTRKTNNKEVR